MALSDKEQAEFEDIARRAGVFANPRPEWKTRRLSKIAIAAFVVGFVEMIATFTWSIPLGLLGVLLMGASVWVLVVFIPKAKAHQLATEDRGDKVPH